MMTTDNANMVGNEHWLLGLWHGQKTGRSEALPICLQ